MEINAYLLRLFQTIKEMEGLNFFTGKSKLSRTEFRLLREIVLENEQGRDIISSELARRLGVTRSAISQLVSKLEKQGVVRRVAASDDKKIAYVRLSERAVSAFEAQCKNVNLLAERVVAEFGAERPDALIDTNHEFLAVVKKVRGEEKAPEEGTAE